jgi:hypothetical protein
MIKLIEALLNQSNRKPRQPALSRKPLIIVGALAFLIAGARVDAGAAIA